jgi:hypothetical protein
MINMPVEGLLQEPRDFSLVLGGRLYQMYRRAHLTGPALGNSFAVVREMRVVPFTTSDAVRLLVATIVPMSPLLLTIMPLDQPVTEAIKFVFLSSTRIVSLSSLAKSRLRSRYESTGAVAQCAAGLTL